MAADYPTNPFTFNAQSTANDFGGDTTDALGDDHNDVGEEVEAHGADLRAAFGKETATDLADAVDKLIDLQTDGRIPISTHDFDIGATTLWTLATAPDGGRAWKFDGTGVESIRAPVQALHRTAASKGVRLNGFEISWDILDDDISGDVAVSILKRTFNGDGNVPSLSLVAFTYDALHDTADERKNHAGAGVAKRNTATLTLDTPEFWDGTAHYAISFLVNDTGGSTGSVVLYGGFALVGRAFNDFG